MMLISLAVISAFKKAQELTFQFCGELPTGEKLWYEIPFFKGIDKAIVKSIWRHYISYVIRG
mgnify:FL=1